MQVLLSALVFAFFCVAGRAQAQAPDDLTRGLVAYFPFEQTSADAGPLQNEVTAHGSLDFQAGVRGQCLVLDGTTYLTVADSPALHYDHFTYCAWVQPVKPNFSGRVFEKGSNDSSWLYVQNHHAQTGFYDDGYRDVTGRTNVPNDQWTFIAGSYDGENLSIYVNGNLESVMMLPGKIRQSKEPLFIGWKGHGIPLDRFTGGLDEIRVYNRALTPTEVQLLYKQDAR